MGGRAVTKSGKDAVPQMPRRDAKKGKAAIRVVPAEGSKRKGTPVGTHYGVGIPLWELEKKPKESSARGKKNVKTRRFWR